MRGRRGPAPSLAAGRGHDELGLTPAEVRGEAIAMTGAGAAAAAEGVRLEAAGRYAGAAAAFDRAAIAAAAANDDPPAFAYLRSRARAMTWRAAFAAGREVALTDAADPTLAGWRVDYGVAEPAPGGNGIVCRGDADSGDIAGPGRTQVRCLADFGHDWDLSFDLSFVTVVDRRTDGGLLLVPRDAGRFHSVRFYRQLGAVKAESGLNDEPNPARVKIPDACRVRVVCRAGRVWVWLNDAAVLADKDVLGLDRTGDLRVAFGGLETRPGDVLRFGNVRIKPLKP